MNKISRRMFLRGILGGGILLAGGAVFAKSAFYRKASNDLKSLGNDSASQYLRQLITRDSTSSRCIMWESEAPLASPQLEYRKKGTEKILSLPASDVSFSDDGQEHHQYSVEIPSLQSGTTYEYRTSDGDEKSGWHLLETDAGGSFKALIFPDSQSSDYTDWERLAQDAARRNPDAAFFVNMGDIVDNGEDHTQWEAWFHGVEGIMDRIPFVPVMGNHETYDQNWNVRLPLAYLNYFIVPENHSVPFSRYYYSFDYGDVHFMVLNSQWDETSDFKQGLKEEQQAWLREDSEKTGKKWRIVLIHKDVLQYRIHQRPERKEGFSDVGDAFMPLFDELGIDIVFTAHLHTYRNRGHIYHFERNTKGPLYILTGVAGNVRYPGLWIDHALDEAVAPQPETDNYLTLEASRERLVVRSFLPDGTEIDHAEITKQRI